MKNILFSLLFFLTFVSNSFSQIVVTEYPPLTPLTNVVTYDWRDVDQLIENGLPRQAIEKILVLQEKASTEYNVAEYWKSCELLDQLLYRAQYEQDENQKFVWNLAQKAKTTPFPMNNILHLQIAKWINSLYWNGSLTFDDESLAWDINGVATKLHNQSYQQLYSYHQRMSLNDAESLMRISSSKIANDEMSDDNTKYFFTVFDVIANEIILSTNNYRSGNNRTISDSTFYGSTADFSKSKNFSDSNYLNFQLYQHLEKLCLANERLNAYAYWVDRRLDLVYEFSTYEKVNNFDREKLLFNAYLRMEKFLILSPASGRFTYHAAYKMNQNAATYHWKNNPDPKNDAVLALKKINASLAKYPTCEYNKQLADLKKFIQYEYLDFSIKGDFVKGKPSLLNFEYRNTKNALLKVYKVSKINQKSNPPNELKSYEVTPIYSTKVTFAKDSLYLKHDMDMILQGFSDNGKYLFILGKSDEAISDLFKADTLSKKKDYAFKLYNICSIDVLTKEVNGKVNFMVMNSWSGQPIEGAKINLEKRYYGNRKGNVYTDTALVTNENGSASFEANESYTYDVHYKDDSISGSVYSYHYTEPSEQNRYKIYTDRGIYRPGQEVYIKVIGYSKNQQETKLTSDKSTKITVKDQNGKVLFQKTVAINDFGSGTCSFMLPQNGFLPGNISIDASSLGYASIRVEEYKRPTYEVKFNEFKDKIKIGDSLKVTGTVTAFACYPIEKADVKITISQSNYFPRWCDIGYAERNLEIEGEVTTDSKGNFTFTFLPKRGKYMYGSYFEFNAIATDISGEVQEDFTSLYIGEESYNISTDIPENIVAGGKNTVAVHVRNSEVFEQEKAKIDYTIVKKTIDPWFTSTMVQAEYPSFTRKEFEKKFPSTRYFGQHYFEKTDTIFKGSLKSGQELNLSDLVKNEAGQYKFVASTIDQTGEKSVTEQTFNFIQPNSKKGQHKSEFWAVADKTSAKVGDQVNLTMGSSYSKLFVYREDLNSLGEVSGKWMTLKGQTTLPFTITQKEKDGFFVNMIAMKEGHLLTQSVRIYVINNEKNLDVKLSTVKDFLKPGSKETWNMTVSDLNGMNKKAELLVGMYDASLDQFQANYWEHSFFTSPNFYLYWNQNYNPNLLNNSSNWGGENYYEETTVTTRNSPKPMMMAKGNSGASPVYAMAEQKSGENKDIMELSMDSTVALEAKNTESTKPATKPRTNFNETAFFYPSVYADSSGNYRFEFTLPDALTRWKLMSLAHTKDLKTGYYEHFFEAKKEVMVEPNEPRFFREGDRFVFSSKVVNTTDTNQVVNVRLKWLDPITEQDVSSLFGTFATQKITLAAKSSQDVSWEMAIPSGKMSLVAYYIEAEGSNFSDAEKKPIPILSNKMLISEAKPFVKTSKGDETFTLEKVSQISPTAEKISLDVEMQTQPLWTTLMSLPYLMEYPYECAEKTFSRYFGNILAQKIIQDNPSFAKVITAWKSSDPKAFLSELEKNPELKSILLNETPWIMDAQNEAQQRAHLSTLFDGNTLITNILSAMSKLKEMQSTDGGWGWFGGVESNVYITQHIVSGFGQLKQLGVKFDEQMVLDALKFLDDRYSTQFNNLKKEDKIKLSGLSDLHIHWLVARSYFKTEATEVSKYYMQCLQKDWKKLNLYTQALAGLSAIRSGDKVFADKIKKSILDRSTKRPQMGMYWNENKTGYYWNQSQVETQSTLISFFTELGNLDKEVQQMQLWLLQQKRTNAWETTKSTTIACHALLINKTSIENQLAQVVNVKMGDGTDLGVLKNDSGSTFHWSGKEITSGKGSVTVTSSNEQPVFGAIHFQYLEEMDKVTKSNGDIRLERHFYWSNNGKEEEIVQGVSIPVGTKIKVKMMVVSNRDMEFVHLKDSKASGFEARETLSGYHYSSVSYYQISKDASTEIFIDYLPKGTHTFEYDIFASGKGDLTVGAAIVECMYAPSFRANSNGGSVIVK